MKILKKFICFLFGHIWAKRLKGRLCERCGRYESFYIDGDIILNLKENTNDK